MRNFKDANGIVYSIYEGREDLIKPDWVEMTAEEWSAYIAPKVSIPDEVTMRQARIALLRYGLLSTIESAIINGVNEEMKIEWEYALTVRRDWPSLVSLTQSMGMTSAQLDELFILASTL